MKTEPFLNADLTKLAPLQPADWSDLFPVYKWYINTGFCFPFKISAGNAIAAVGAAIVHNKTAWLGHIVVHPGQRNKGLGQLMTQSLVDFSRSKNCETIYLLATDLGAPVYQKTGFITETDYLIFKDIQPVPISDISENIVPFHSGFKDQVFRLDALVSGEDRRSQLAQHTGNGYVFLSNEKVEGFYLPGFGDGIILSENPAAGTALMKLRLQTKNFASFPEDNEPAAAFIHQHGFAECKRVKRMRLGRPKKWHPQQIYNRIAGNLG